MKKLLYTVLLLILIIPNTPIVGTEILRRIDPDYFRYSNSDGSLTFIQHIDIFSPWPSRPELIDGAIILNDDTLPQEKRQMYRLYKVNPLCFWRWRYYIAVAPLFEYKSWDEIEPNREPRKPNYVFQHF